jgi:hypothetical protein
MCLLPINLMLLLLLLLLVAGPCHRTPPHPAMQSLVRIPETLLCAMEFISLYTPAEHNGPLEELRKLVAPSYMELMSRSNKTFWLRKVRPTAAAAAAAAAAVSMLSCQPFQGCH